MKKFILILLTLGLAGASFAQPSSKEKITALLSAYAKLNLFNGTALVAQKGNVLLQQGYGTSKTGIFQIYSITKTFTSTLVLKLAEQHKLSISDKLSKYYPTFPNGDNITIEQLLSHTSGISDYTHGYDMPDMKEKTFISFLSKKELDFPPGTGWSYSNSGYYLLGFIIQKVTGTPYEKAIHQYILDPLKMEHSGFDFKQLESPDKTIGYATFTSKEKKPAEIYPAPGPFAAGAIYSTAGDLYKYHRALQNSSIITKASLAKAYTPVKNNYGLGWITSSFEGKQVVGHSGGAAGFRSNFIRIPEMDICIILLSNNEIADLDRISRKILAILFNTHYKIPEERIFLKEDQLGALSGTYANSNLTVYLSGDDGRLVAQMAGQPKSILFALDDFHFYVDEIDGSLEFAKDSSGVVQELIIRQGARTVTMEKILPYWGLLGDATTVGWEGKQPDLVFSEDAKQKGIWTIKDVPLTTGNIKFRFNNDWTLNYGDNTGDGILDPGGEDIKVKSGRYDIRLDLSNASSPTYAISIHQP